LSTQPEARPAVESPYLTMDEAAVYTRTSRTTVKRAVASGALRYSSPNPSAVKPIKLFTREQLDAWLNVPARALRTVAEPVPVDPRSRQRRRPS
jgi:hypothetical protein